MRGGARSFGDGSGWYDTRGGGDQNAERKKDVWPGDWTCPKCGANCYAVLKKCYKKWCQEPKPERPIETISGEVMEGSSSALRPGVPASSGGAAGGAAAAAAVAAATVEPGSIPCLAGSSSAGQQAARVEWLTRRVGELALMPGRLTDTLESFGLLRAEGLRPTVATYAHLIGALVLGGDVGGAQAAFEELRREPGVSANLPVYTALIKGHCDVAGDLEAADRLLRAMEEGEEEGEEGGASIARTSGSTPPPQPAITPDVRW
jgi:hypothetical protein